MTLKAREITYCKHFILFYEKVLFSSPRKNFIFLLFFNFFLKYGLFWYYLSYPHCTLHTSTRETKIEGKIGRKNKKNVWQWFVKGCIFMRCVTHFRSWKAWQFVSGGWSITWSRLFPKKKKENHKCQQLYRGKKNNRKKEEEKR